MKRIALFGNLLLLAILSSCAPSPTNTEPPAKLLHDPISGQLTVATPSRTVTSKLNCGCPFALTISGAGDTSIIKYSIPTKDTAISSHTITISAKTAGLAKGTYTSWLALQTPDPNVKFLRDTLRDTLIVP